MGASFFDLRNLLKVLLSVISTGARNERNGEILPFICLEVAGNMMFSCRWNMEMQAEFADWYWGDMKFVEPMISLSLLQGKKPFHLNLKQPKAFQHHAWYPRQMQVKYNVTLHNYFLTLYDLVKR